MFLLLAFTCLRHSRQDLYSGGDGMHVRTDRVSVHTLLIIITAFKAANRDFLPSPHSASNRLQHVRLSGPGAIVCIERLARANVSCCMPRGTKGQLSC